MNNIWFRSINWAWQEISAYSISLHRTCFGLIMFFAVIRFWMMGWIDTLYIEPKFFFSYTGFEWLKPWSSVLLIKVHFVGLACSSLMIALGFYPRIFSGIFFVLFFIVEVWDKATYLNHYYLISLLSFLYIWIPSAGFFSILPSDHQKKVSKIFQFLLQFQIICIYFFAGFAKLNMDWLLEGKPLLIWLKPYFDWYLPNAIKEWLSIDLVAIMMSWFGAIFDLLMPIAIYSRFKKIAFIIACFFHLFVWILFPIGMFSLIMVSSLLLFVIDDDTNPKIIHLISIRQKIIMALVFIWVSFHLLFPLRYLSDLDHHVNWYENHFRFSWRVMLVEKVGFIEFRVKHDHHETHIYPRDHLTKQQFQQMSIQADLILEYAHYLSNFYHDLGYQQVEVYANSMVAYQGLKMKPFVNPNIDLSKISKFQNHKDFMMPPPLLEH